VGNRNVPNEVSHLWVLAKMLTTLKSERALLFRFMKYVVAASHPKMNRRFVSPSSKEYWQCFNSVKLEDIPFRAIQAASMRKSFQIELENDRKFLIVLGKGKIFSDYEERFPNIASVIRELPGLKDETFELFNDTTWKEYHHLFIALMGRYKDGLDLIASNLNAKDGEPIEDILNRVVETGHALLTMVKGRAFYLYLSTIASKLSKCLSERSEIESEEDDAEVVTTLWDHVEVETATTALWKPFKSWVMLMLVQLDAADALCAFVKQEELGNSEIDVKIVYAPVVSDKTIPLEDLLTQPKYIPEAPMTDPKTNTKLLDFIKTANTLKKQTECVGSFKKNWGPMRASDAQLFLQEVMVEAKKEHEEDSKQRNGGVDPNEMILELSSEILALLQQGSDAGADIIAKFSALEIELKERQARYNLPFSEKATFKGALHCEACLASVLDQTTRKNIRAWIDTLKKDGKKKKDWKKQKDEELCRSLSQLLEETKVGFFSVRLVPTVNPCSIHDNRISLESLGYQNVVAQCAVVFLLIYRWMETPPPPALSRQVFTIPSQAAPYQNGPQNCGWMV
jgi:hypothetical protein